MSFAGRSGLRHIALASERPKGLLAGHQAIVLSLGDGFVMRPPPDAISWLSRNSENDYHPEPAIVIWVNVGS